MICPKCRVDSPEDSRYCRGCGGRLPQASGREAAETVLYPTAPKELEPGSTFAGRYQVIEELGRGGMGRLYKVFDTKIKEKIALKLIKPEIASDKETIERFSNELRLARKIGHRNVCRMFDLGEAEGSHFITMEYVHGEDLKSMIRMSTGLTVGTVLSVGKQVCEGLAEAHSLGVVHRDLKPQNIMIDKGGNAKIMDFGIARSVREKGMTGPSVLLGTPEYMSPEQAEAKEVDQRSDIYSLGVILYEMATGRVPFEGDTALSIALKHRGEAPKNPAQLNPNLPADLAGVILKCLEKDKAKRYQSASDVRSELDKIEKGIPTTQRVVPEHRTATSREITVKLNLKKLLIPGLGVLAVATLAFVILKFIPQKQVPLAPKIENSVAVIGFENLTGDKSLDDLRKAIPNLLITSLEQSGEFYVATWERMHDLLKQMGKGDVDLIGPEMGFEACRREGIKTIVLGTFTRAGNMFATDIKILDVESKKLVKSASSRGEGVDSILKTQIDELSSEISRGLGLAAEKPGAQPLPVAEVTTSSIEAYRYFLRGSEELEKLYYDQARNLFEKAVEMDPAFATAYRGLAYVYNRLGDANLRNVAIEKAMALARKATEKERLFIEAQYTIQIKDDYEKGIRLYNEIAKKYPKEKWAYFWLCLYATNLDQGIAEINKALELDPNFALAVNVLANCILQKGDWPKALELFKRYASLSPGDANPFDSMAALYFQMGKMDEAIANFKEALRMKPDFYISIQALQYIAALREDYPEVRKWLDQLLAVVKSPGIVADGYWLEGFYYAWLGSTEKALNEIQKAVELAGQIGNPVKKSFLEETKAWIYHDQREFDLSRKCFKNFAELYAAAYPKRLSYAKAYGCFFEAMADLGQGRISPAKSSLAEMKALLPKVEAGKDQIAYDYACLNGEVLLAEGKTQEAISILEKRPLFSYPSYEYANQLISHNFPFLKDGLARAYEKNGEIDRAITEYERLTKFDLKDLERFLIHPKYHYRLAKLYEQKGLKAKAAERYQRFLSLWKDADPGWPEVEDARKRLARL